MRVPAIICLFLLLLNGTGQARELTSEELEKWFASDELTPPSTSTVNVNEGDLVFLLKQPNQVVHHHATQLVIDSNSLSSGWVRIKQCHRNLDQVSRAQIVYKKDKVTDLQITTSRNIEQVWVENNSVQLRNITADAYLCVTARSRALVANHDGSFSLRNGPFMRRFLDGYYPMHVSMQVIFPDEALQWQSIMPARQQGFRVWNKTGQVNYDAWFEGQLKTELRFTRASM